MNLPSALIVACGSVVCVDLRFLILSDSALSAYVTCLTSRIKML